MVKVNERVMERDLSLTYGVNIGANNFRVSADYRAVEVIISTLRFLPLIGNGGKKDAVNLTFYQVLDVAVHQLGRIADRFGRDGFYSLQIKAFSRRRRQHYAKAQLSEKSVPEGVVFELVKHARYAHRSPYGQLFGQRLVVEHPVFFVLVQVRQTAWSHFNAGAFFTAVA